MLRHLNKLKVWRHLTQRGQLANMADDVVLTTNALTRSGIKEARKSGRVAEAVEDAIEGKVDTIVDKTISDAFNEQPKKMSFTKKAVLGGGAVAGGVLGYNALTGGGAANDATFAQAENAGAQAAVRDAMAEGYGPVMMGAPMPQIEAANANHMGMIEGAQLARG